LVFCCLALPILALAQDARSVDSLSEKELLELYGRHATGALYGSSIRVYPERYAVALSQAQAANMELQRRATGRQEDVVRWSLWLTAVSLAIAVLSTMLTAWTLRQAARTSVEERHRHAEELVTLRELLRIGRRRRRLLAYAGER
jgi:hypothetical protein